MRRTEDRLGEARGLRVTRTGHWGRVVDTLVGLVPTGTPATGGHDVVTAEFALATWFTRLKLAIPTMGWVEPWRV